MKNLKSFFIIFILLFSFSTGNAQYAGIGYSMYGPGFYGATVRGNLNMIALNSGKVSSLRGISRVNIVYDYSKMGVDLYRVEQEFLDKKKLDFKSDTVRFEKFKRNWFDARKKYFEPSFSKAFNKHAEKIGMSGVNYSTDNAVTLKVETVYTFLGFINKDFEGESSSIDFECTFLDKDGNELLRYYIKNATALEDPGPSLDPGPRLTTVYAKAAKLLMKDLKNQLNKAD